MEFNSAEVQGLERHLQEECTKSQALDSRVHELEADCHTANERLQETVVREKEIIEKSRTQIQNQQQTISLLVSEKASLTASLDRLEELESRMHHFAPF
jgi:myosin protein heavy chain